MKIVRPAFLAALLIAAVCAGIAHAATGSASVTFQRPTAYADQSPLPVADILRYDVQCTFRPTGGVLGPCATTPTNLTLPGNAQAGTFTLTIPQVGGQACFRLLTVVQDGRTSVASNEGCSTLAPIPLPNPNPATGVTVTVSVMVVITP